MVELVREYGLKEHVIYGTDRTVIACIGDKRMVDKGAIENAPMVERIVPILAPYKMASTEVRTQRTEVRIASTTHHLPRHVVPGNYVYVYDPTTGMYRFDYSIFIGFFIGLVLLSGTVWVIVRAWRKSTPA